MKTTTYTSAVFFLSICLCCSLVSCTPSGNGNAANGNEEVATMPAHERHFVTISEMKFNPAEIYVKAGDTVEFINTDMVAHDITEETAKEWSSSLLESNKSWSMPVAKSYSYYCSLHPVMKGKIIVR